VYAGGGLIGYGQLIILKHNDTYLSAYGHNAKLLVKEGQSVRKGQQIATMGEGDNGGGAGTEAATAF
jgi:lipoprotein NlpD